MIGPIMEVDHQEKQTKNDGPAPAAGGRLFSIGHSNHELPRLLGLLRRAGVTAVADVRSSPYSRRLPQFNRPELEDALTGCGISYLFLGYWLGGRPDEAELYDDEGRVDYERVQQTPAFREGLAELRAALDAHRVALLCAEEDPLDCHRALMIAPALAEEGVATVHLRGDGSAESAEALERRLLALTGLDERLAPDLFGGPGTEERRKVLAEAYRVQARRRAFRLPPSQRPASEGEDFPS
jgi:hypothetical protein